MGKLAWLTGCGVFLQVLALAAQGQAYPERPIRLILPSPAGASSNDILARATAERLSRGFGQQVIVDNRAGAHGNIGAALVARAAPDGHTLLAGNTGPLTINPSMYPDMGYDPDRDLAPIARFVTVPYVLVVNPSLPVHSVKELIALARAQPGKLNYGSSGVGGVPHLAAELFKRTANIDIVHIPYNGAARAHLELVAGQVQFNFTGVTGVLSFIKAGKLRALAVPSPARSTLMPDVPTTIEAGLKDLQVSTWLGVLGPAQLRPAVIDRIYAEVARVAGSDEMRDFFRTQGAESAVMNPGEFRAFIKAERMKWGQIVKSANIKES
jgi:tripartite-type tricarboxylate transporter receptor subunit TctC